MSTGTRSRRKSSGLGGEPRGDTGAPAVSTLDTASIPAMTTASRASSSSRDAAHRPHSKRRKAKGLLGRWKTISLRHTWLNPLILILIVLAGYAVNPTPENPLHSAIFLSYPLPRPDGADPSTPIQYGKGGRDFAFVGFYIIVLSFTREFIMQRIVRPWAIWCGITKKGKQARFMEQVYTAIYFGIFSPLGLYVMKRSPIWYFNTTAMFEGFPHRSHEPVFKAYYLLQAAYWAQQAIVLILMLEKPRKDFKELVGHHIVTVALIWLSYRFHFTYMGLAVYIAHDISDFFIATSKTLNYLDSIIVGPYYIFFLCVWVYLRHYINLRILWAVLTEFRTVGPFELNWETQQYKCWISQIITFSLLAALQIINLIWFFLLIRILKNYIFNSVKADERSDNEEDDEETVPLEEEEDEQKTKPAPEIHLNGHAVNGSSSSNGAAAASSYEKANGSADDLTKRRTAS
ncbi:longevity assurance proteins LAG1/LAC1 [Xylona heveae TC161]|uniref:Longevity assurance proteins LAG1/LAC1 n=1 Tax=Xylona heveae (strain CBS 132557 / TC161) TaxID=1328760 RepID=A0A165K2Y4_XYLHT|nr:longevity assurance proteins LAG1/LAC1 [Xylona heveae TC161]KZF26926.1 longevity assurance proteins LAG1/LAC1 [Xylona heveae TC161]